MKTITLPLLILFAVFSSVATARIYKTVDEKGNVVFTDKPSRTQPSEPVTLKPIIKLPLPESTTRSFNNEPDKKTTDTRAPYEMFSIIRPTHDSTVRNNGDFTIKVAITPSLARGHKVRFFIDDEPVTGPQRTLSHSAKNMDRGTHRLKVELLDTKGKVLQSDNSTVHVQRHVYRPPVAP